MIELLRTPMFIGQSPWPLHCARPMVFVGSWGSDDDYPEDYAAMLEDAFDESPGLLCHVWCCSACGALTWQGER